MSRLGRKSVSLSALATLVLGAIVVLVLPAISAGAGDSLGNPRFSIIIQGAGISSQYRRYIWVGTREAACEPGRRVDVTASVGGGISFRPAQPPMIIAKVFCNRFDLGSIEAHDPGDGTFSSVGPLVSAGIGGLPDCAAKWGGGGSQFASWTVVCRFF